MARHYGIPYMGSKQKLVDHILPFIIGRHPGVDTFYDLFGGGGSASLYVVSKYPKLQVHYNELSLAIGSLMEQLRSGEELSGHWVDRDTFEREYTGNDAWAGLLQTCWTFGNNQKGYLYGRQYEEFKEKLTDLVMTGEGDIRWLEQTSNDINLAEYGKEVNTQIFLNPKRYTTPYQRRIVLARQIPNIGALQHMAKIERLVQIQNMPGISSLEITKGLSYREVKITGKRPLLYCDPPYEDTAEYREGGFDHKAFYDWVMEQKYPVYVSSYKVSDPRLKLVKAIKTRSLLAAAYTDKPSYNYENVYWNGVQ